MATFLKFLLLEDNSLRKSRKLWAHMMYASVNPLTIVFLATIWYCQLYKI